VTQPGEGGGFIQSAPRSCLYRRACANLEPVT